MRPLRPTKQGLSYSKYSLPRRAVMMGACRVSATERTSARAFAQPDPARMVTFFAMLSDSAALLRLAAGGRTEAAGPQIPRSIAPEEHPRAKTSPGMRSE